MTSSSSSSAAVAYDQVKEMETIQIGIIGMGDMGRLYASRFSAAGWKNVNVCDRAENYEKLKAEIKYPNIKVFKDGHLVSRRSDFIIYSVEAAFIDAVVGQYGPSTKQGAVVSGQTSVKAPEKAAFDKHLPEDVYIISCHSMHGPKVDPAGQPLILMQYRAPDEKLRQFERILSCLKSNFVYLTYESHDLITANTQAVTHAAFLSMGTAWHCSGSYPWESGRYAGGIETVKINIMIRIYSAKWHIYAGLALLNPAAARQVTQFANSTTELFKSMMEEDEKGLIERLFKARRSVFGWEDEEEGVGGARTKGSGEGEKRQRQPILMSDKLLDRFQLVARDAIHPQSGDTTGAPASDPAPPNSHLSLLAIVDSWHALGIDPYADLDLAATPIFRIWIGVSEYLFRSPVRLRASIRAATENHAFRRDDTEFVVAARGWAQTVEFGNFELYKWRFEQTSSFFRPRFEEANLVGAQMLKAVGAGGVATQKEAAK